MGGLEEPTRNLVAPGTRAVGSHHPPRSEGAREGRGVSVFLTVRAGEEPVMMPKPASVSQH